MKTTAVVMKNKMKDGGRCKTLVRTCQQNMLFVITKSDCIEVVVAMIIVKVMDMLTCNCTFTCGCDSCNKK